MAIFKRCAAVFVFWELTLLLIMVTRSSSRQIHEVESCDSLTFTAQCAKNEVILIEKAFYGRKDSGKCVQDIKGKTCIKDVKQFMSSRCSGRQNCQVVVTKTDPYLRDQRPCSLDLTWHMYVTYTCQIVERVEQSTCRHSVPIPATTLPGYLSSHIAKQGAGSSSCPWEIKVPNGQRIQITAYNFMDRYETPDRASGSCYIFARVNEGETNGEPITLCPTDIAEKKVYESTLNTIQFYFSRNVLKTHLHTEPEYLIKYKAIGCPDLPKIKGASFLRSGDDLMVKCNSTGERWHLTCEGEEWRGKQSNCTSSQKAVAQGWALFDSNQGFPYALVLVVAIGVALGILLGGTTLIIVSYRMKRKHPRYEMPPEPCLNYQTSSARERMEKDKTGGQLYTGTVPPRRQWTDGTNNTVINNSNQHQQHHSALIGHHHLQHQTVTPPDYNFNSSGKTEQTMVDSSHNSAPHLYESPQVS